MLVKNTTDNITESPITTSNSKEQSDVPLSVKNDEVCKPSSSGVSVSECESTDAEIKTLDNDEKCANTDDIIVPPERSHSVNESTDVNIVSSSEEKIIDSTMDTNE